MSNKWKIYKCIMFSILEHLETDNEMNDKGLEDYSLFSIETPCDYESCLQLPTWT